VKNLENVQGDERDAILISVGYGRDEGGLVSHNFGPLNQQGGERRLNVLVTRAKRRCEVFTNLTADDIDLSRSNARGVKALKTFLQYARDGVLDAPEPTDLGPDSEFEVEVAHELRNLGYEIDGQVGSGGFFVDLAVKDPRAPGRYLLGIECDGATYHSSKWARDRDRLREEVLIRLGWQIHRIWSTDWFMNPEREVRRVQEAIEGAKTLTHHQTKDVAPITSALPTVLERAEPELDLDMGLKAAPYVKATFRVTPHRRFKLFDQPPDRIAPWVQRVVEIEGPIHRDLVVARIAECADLHAVHANTRAAVQKGIQMAVKRRLIKARGEFLWKLGEELTLRDWTTLPPSQRKIEFTSPEEIGLALFRVVEAAISIKREEAVLRAGRLLGYLRISDQIHATIDSVIPGLLQNDRLGLSADELTLPR
jgi:very-short-patch-repair endonuclease